MNARTVSINTDIGEGFGVWGVGDEAPLMDQVTAANIACGFHAGDPDTLRSTCEMASARGVSVGAQVSYRDLVGFGRRFIDVPTPTLVNDILYQIGALQAFARIAGTEVSYVKAHGALYNTAARHHGQAHAIVEAIGLLDPELPVLCQYGTVLWNTALDAGLSPHAEVFIDRSYTDDGLLVPRSHPDALVLDPSAAAKRAVQMFATGSVVSVGDQTVAVVPEDAATIAMCIHSDAPGAVGIARRTRSLLEQNGVALVPIGDRRHD
ncbi:LamB/YcsF family protein [Rhodococcus jostii]|uniref:UPF0271 protein n=1 Tax=Rhodococcus jostii TaxID=132919 RepID=A0A1H5MAM7_RHOJO|nr:5-oxoprolinase subunit PxpA [Rhodococcus jostii]SEE86559.1 UPF0271 protein [Rhodococcus jostii]